jgi:hypothetical protein
MKSPDNDSRGAVAAALMITALFGVLFGLLAAGIILYLFLY